MFIIRTATQDDIELFMEIRLKVLNAVFGTNAAAELPVIENFTSQWRLRYIPCV